MARFPRPIDLLNITIGIAGLTVERNIPFGRHARQKLDVYRPANAQTALSKSVRKGDMPPVGLQLGLPVIVFFYGGSWQSGERRDYRFIAALLARRGFVVVVPDYRIYPERKFPGFLEDSAAATAWVLKNISEHDGDAGAVFLMGHSAGAYNAVMLGLDASYLKAVDADPARIAGIIGLAGPYDFLPLRDPVLEEIFVASGDLKVTQPINHVRECAPPFLLAHGGKDRTVWPRNTAILAARLREVGGAVESRIYPKLGHISIILASLPYLSWRAPLLRDVLHFISACRNGEFADARTEISQPMVR
jgi:acetyl esterase/lipase